MSNLACPENQRGHKNLNDTQISNERLRPLDNLEGQLGMNGY